MNTKYILRLLTFLTLLLGSSGAARAQSVPYGNEWIVPGQQYVKIKIWRDGLYRLDQQYLSQAGLGSVDPSLIQLWRRGREVAIFGGGNQRAPDPTTFFEFYGQRNDGVLDADYYKNPADQPHKLYSFYTDTASYFLTYARGTSPRPGRRMAEPTAAGGTPHAHRLQNVLKLTVDFYKESPIDTYTYLPWLEGGEGFYSTTNIDFTVSTDTLLRALLPSPAPRVEMMVVGGTNSPQHTVDMKVIPPGGPARLLGIVQFPRYGHTLGRFPLAATDIAPSGKLTVQYTVRQSSPPQVPADGIRTAYVRVIAPQANRWFADRRQVLFQNDSLLSGPATYEYAPDDIPVTVAGFDVHDPYNVQRVRPAAGAGGGRRYVFGQAGERQTRWLLLADEARPMVPEQPARAVTFRTLDPAKPTFLIITHKQLMGPAAGVPNAARAYAAYRASAAGGAYDTLMVTSHQLYDQFHYGERSVLALRHFGLWMAAAQPVGQTKYLLLLGKGLTPNEPFTLFNVDARTVPRAKGEQGLDLVPTSTRSVSDNFLTADWPRDDYVARLPTGRVTARTPEEVMAYLNKLKEYEQPGLADWRRNALNLAGGESAADYEEFPSLMNKYKKRIEQPVFSGRVVRTFSRGALSSGNVLPIGINIATELNAGLGLITYFGHGYNTTFNLNLGDINDPANNYTNQGKYPVMFYNGCAAGLTTVNYPTFAESWLLAPNRGAIGMMGESGFSFTYLLDPAQDSTFRLLFNDPAWYGKPVTVVHSEVVRRLQKTDLFRNNLAGVEQLLSCVWLGDPTIALYAPPRPDFIAADARLSVGPAAGQAGPVEASTPDFVLNIGVSNPGMVTRDPVDIEVTRTYPAGASRPSTVTRLTFRPAYAHDTTYAFPLRNEGNVFGSNQFRVVLDYGNKVVELSETNNTAQTSYTFLQGGITAVSPPEFAIVPTATPRLVVQTNDPAGPARGYEFELDTVPSFGSPLRRQFAATGSLTADWQPTLPALAGRDSVVWYWRTRFAAPVAGEDNRWVVSSFRHIAGSPGGWSQSHYGQFQRDERRGLDVSTPGGRWSFAPLEQALRLRTTGGGLPTARPTFGTSTAELGISTDVGNPPYLLDCAANAPGFLVAVYDQRTLRPLAVPGGGYLSCGRDGQSFYVFGVNPASAADTLNNINNSAVRQADLGRLLTNVPDGAYVALISMNRVRYAALPAELRTALGTLLGSKLISQGQLRNGDPLALLAQKQVSGGQLVGEAGPDLSAGAPARNTQLLTLNGLLRSASSAGTLLSTRIGPARQWGTLYHTIKSATATATGARKLRLLGVDEQGRSTELNPSVSSPALDVSAIPASQYPYIQLELTLSDAETRVPPQLRQWLLTYAGVPEGVVRRDLAPAGAYEVTTLTKQANEDGQLRVPVVFQNISGIAFRAPLNARIELRDASNSVVRTALVVSNRVLKPDSSVTLLSRIDVRGLFGTLTARAEVNPLLDNAAAQPELYHFNNQLTLPPITLTNRNVPPVLDVAFDGRRILSGELVSPVPLISIQLRDEDRLRHIKDARYFTVLLQGPGQATPVPVDLAGGNISFRADSTSRPGTTATLEYLPGKAAPLANGLYTLHVQGRDPGNATAGTQDYVVKFEVENESAITNVYPYPNPVTSKARFVFTVTGRELPRNLRIQIMTLTGKVVREIFMAELGPLHIGNNLTDFAWDGTDQYGDRLANGTYLYRVRVDEAGGGPSFKRRETGGDKAFAKDWGKLVLLR